MCLTRHSHVVTDDLLQGIGIAVMMHGGPIRHGYFHSLGVMWAYSVFVTLLLHPPGARPVDSFFFAAAGSGAHLFEDALAYRKGYARFWSLSDQRCDTGAFEYTRDWDGIAGGKVLIAGVITLVGALVLWWVWRR